MIEKRTQTPKLLPRPSEWHQASIRKGSGMPCTVVAHLCSMLGMLTGWETRGAGLTHGDLSSIPPQPKGPEVLWCQGQAQGDKVAWEDEDSTWTSSMGQMQSSQDIIYLPGIHCEVWGGTLMIKIIPVIKDEPDYLEAHSLF